MKEKHWLWLARLLPRELAKWTFIRVVAAATTGPYGNTNVTTCSVMDALQRWDAGARG